MDFTGDYVSLRNEIGACLTSDEVVRVTGPDAGSFLQGQCSQDLSELGTGQSVRSWVLSPQGRAGWQVRISRISTDEFILVTDEGSGDALASRLSRFLLRTKVAVSHDRDLDVLAVRGPLSDLYTAPAQVHRVDSFWSGIQGHDWVGPAESFAVGLKMVGPEALDAVRVEAGVPRSGVEYSDGAIPAELGQIENLVSFTKGCYVGQELVARIDSRGHVNRRLVGLRVLESVIPIAGSQVNYQDSAVGEITSVAESLSLRSVICLGTIRREVESGATIQIVRDGRSADAVVQELPFLP